MSTYPPIFAVLSLGLSMALQAGEPATSHFQKSYAPKPGGTLRVETAFHDVSVTIASTASIEVISDLKISSWPQDAKQLVREYEPVVLDQGNTLLVRVKSETSFHLGWNRVEGKVAIRMPPGMNLTFRTGSGDVNVQGDPGAVDISCETGSGDFRADGSCNALAVRTGSGDVVARLAGPVGKATFRTGSGDIDLRGAIADLGVTTGSGEVRVEGLTGTARFHTGSGDVRASWAQLPQGTSLDASTASGDLTLALPGSSAVAGTLGTSSGDIRSDFPGTLSSRGHIFSLAGPPGSAKIQARTSSGDVALRKR